MSKSLYKAKALEDGTLAQQGIKETLIEADSSRDESKLTRRTNLGVSEYVMEH